MKTLCSLLLLAALVALYTGQVDAQSVGKCPENNVNCFAKGKTYCGTLRPCPVGKWCCSIDCDDVCWDPVTGKCPLNNVNCLVKGKTYCDELRPCPVGQWCCSIDCDDVCWDPVTGKVAVPQPPPLITDPVAVSK